MSVVIRVRTRWGMLRVDTDPSETVEVLAAKVESLLLTLGGSEPNGVKLCRLERPDQTLSPNSTVASLSLKHGDMICLYTPRSTPQKPNTSSTPSAAPPTSTSTSTTSSSTTASTQMTTSTPTSSTATYKDPALCPNNHGPNASCIMCSNVQAPPVACMHPANMTCPQCMPKNVTGRDMSWMCTHPPGAKCVNCLPPPKSASTSAAANSRPPTETHMQCRHPPNMKCPRCFVTTDKPLERKCEHGPLGRCEHCLPKEAPSAAPPNISNCPNHGPHGCCSACLQRITESKLNIKRQAEVHSSGAVLNHTAVDAFQQYVSHTLNYSEQRCAWLYGTYSPANATIVHAIYEPPQKGSKGGFSLLADKFSDTVDALANTFGLKRVGWIFTHSPRRLILTASEIAFAAKQQAKYGDKFITVALKGDVGVKMEAEAFQVSDQAAQLAVAGMIVPSPDEAFVSLKETVFLDNRETKQVDDHWFIHNIPVTSTAECVFQQCVFPIENRSRTPQRPSDMIVHMKQSNKPWPKKLSDFHFLLYLVTQEIFTVNVDLPALAQVIQARNPAHCDYEGFEEILEERLKPTSSSSRH